MLRPLLERVRSQIFLLLTALVFVFMPALFAEPIIGDDGDLFARLAPLTDWNFSSLLPRGGLYYRPLTILTYHFDKLFWQLNPLAMHLENLVLHAINTLLVFFLARIFLPEKERKSSLLPLAAALLFGLHPLTAESVNWISGRTDPLAALFILLAALAILRYRRERRLLFLFLAGFSYLLAILSKEVAIAFLPGAICLYFAGGVTVETIASPLEQKKRQFIWVGAWCGAIVLSFLTLYSLTLSGRSGRLILTLKIIFSDLWYALFVSLRAFAFYLQKILWPFPLNFAILEVDPLYELVAIPLLIGALYLLWRRRSLGALLLTGLFLIIPSFLLAFSQIAWTPYAERYLYLPCAFIVPALLLAARKMVPPPFRKSAAVFVLLLIVAAGSATFARTLTWRSNLSLWSDTVKKSPLSAAARNDYGLALYRAGRLGEARDAFAVAETLTNIDYQPRHGINHARVLVELHDDWGAKSAYEKVLKRTLGKSEPAREGLLEVLKRLLDQGQPPEKFKELQSELLGLKGQKG